MPSVLGAGAADSDSDFSDSDDAVAPEYDEAPDGRDRVPQNRAAPAVASVWPQEPEPEAASAEALLRQKERQLALLQREVLEIKGKLPQLLADERAPSFETPTTAAAAPRAATAAASGALRCVLCQDPLATAPKLVNIMRIPSPALTGPTQCQKCSAVCCAVYCSLAHQQEDDRRHAAECQAIMGDSETREIVEQAKNCRPPVKANRYKCGMSDNHPYEVRRTVSGGSAGGAAGAAGGGSAEAEDSLAKYIARVDRSAALGPGPDKQWAVLRGHVKLPSTSPEAVAKAAATAPPLAAATPWVSFGSSSSIVLNWLPPGLRFDPRVAPQSYQIQQREAKLGGRFSPLFLRFSIGKCRNCPFFRAF
jgi:hypothetical protein